VRAFVVTGPGDGAVVDVEPPAVRAGEVVIDVELAGVCGTDVEFFTGEMAYLHTGQAEFPMRLGHEWSGTIREVGEGVDPALLARRATGDTMLGCGTCRYCRAGRHNVCPDRFEVGVRYGWPGALAEQVKVPVAALHLLPDGVDAAAGSLVEPGGSAFRAVEAAGVGPGDRLLVIGPGTMGLLAAQFARVLGCEVHLLGVEDRSLEFARSLGFDAVWDSASLPELDWDAIIDASTGSTVPARAIAAVAPAGRVVFLGIAGTPSPIDARWFVMKDITAIGILGPSAGLAGTIDRYASGLVDPRRLVAATVGLERVGDVLSGWRPDGAGPGPKILVDPRR
jgi:threonine dehydrogenase-like Zn-dependent dehydrogenase